MSFFVWEHCEKQTLVCWWDAAMSDSWMNHQSFQWISWFSLQKWSQIKLNSSWLNDLVNSSLQEGSPVNNDLNFELILTKAIEWLLQCFYKASVLIHCKKWIILEWASVLIQKKKFLVQFSEFLLLCSTEDSKRNSIFHFNMALKYIDI